MFFRPKHQPFFLLFLLLVLLAFLLGGCGRASRRSQALTDFDLTLAVSPDPPRVGEAELVFSLKDAEGQAVDGARLEIKGDMSHAGMQPVLAEITEGEKGVYKTAFEWTMGGDWIVTVTVTLPDGRTFNRRFDLTVGGQMNMSSQ